jgi:hypothetical protein
MWLRRGETVPSESTYGTDSEFAFGTVIICAVLAALSAVPPHTPMRKAGPRLCGFADHHEIELIAHSSGPLQFGT